MREVDLNHRSLAYEASEIPLLYRAKFLNHACNLTGLKVVSTTFYTLPCRIIVASNSRYFVVVFLEKPPS